MVAIVEVTATEPTRVLLKKVGPLKHVRFVSRPSVSEAVRRVVVARMSDFEERPEELRSFATRGSSFASPFILLAFGARQPSVSALQLLALLTSRSASWKGDPYVSPSVDVVRRILTAHSLGAERQLVASATVEDGILSVWSCEPKLYRCSASEIPVLAALASKALAKLEVSASGSRIRWPDADVDLDLDSIREFIDPEARKEAVSKYRSDAALYGSAIRRVREAHDLRQSKIVGLSEREIRRLENGEVFPHSGTLLKLADAHGLSLPAYMGQLAAQSTSQPTQRRRGSSK
jgi:hypothetical protein